MRPLWVLWALAVTGCASVGVFQQPETLGKGHWQAAAELSSQAQASTDSLSLYPAFGVAFRYGLTETIDVGAKIGPSGLEAQGKFMLTPREGVVISLAPLLGGTFNMPSGLLFGTAQAALPVLIGVPLSKRVQLVFAPRLHDGLIVLSAGQAGGTVNTFSLGGAVGVAVKVKRFQFIPDVGFLAPIATTTWRSDLPSGTVWGQGRWTFQANVTVTLGSVR
ncbi:MAG: hypothetical protein Q8N23_11090 [Archangium sp.]|nr:hypothetical protein [Archangium sp.]MDP3570242.1 hypothetical protein [Archangium sp.]